MVLAAIQQYAPHVDFLYTDISPQLVGYGRKTYGLVYPFARFQLLDVDRDVESQGCGMGTYDIVFATNVLHATANMSRSIGNCKVMLRKGGLLLANELTTKTEFLTLTFGLTDGWWLFEDAECRIPGAPLLDRYALAM